MSSSRHEQEAKVSKTSVEWDHGSHEEFYEYYKEESAGSQARSRFRAILDMILRLRPTIADSAPCEIADVGCGAGTQSLLWAELGHNVHGLDVNEPLLELGRRRAADAGYHIEFVLGSAVSLPWPDESMHVCLAAELLEHVPDWRTCLMEFARVVRPGGVLFLSTNNVLCPVQQEFNLPIYSWYPGPIKRYCEKLSVTTRPRLANYAKYPATNWFSFYQLRKFLNERGFDSLDRFDLIDTSGKGTIARAVLLSVRKIPPLRWMGHVATPGTAILAVKRPSER